MWNKRSKFGAVKSGGYDSKKEHKRALELELLQKANEIADLQKQVKFQLLASFKDSSGKTERGISYIADFVYFDKNKNKLVCEDSKGFKTTDYIIKRKLFKHKYPEYIFIES